MSKRGACRLRLAPVISERYPTMSEFIFKKQEVAAEARGQPERLRRVLVLYTGGTIGMKWSDEIGKGRSNAS